MKRARALPLHASDANVEAGPTRSFEGPGLGLTLARHYLELNGATITVDSQKGVGSTFTILFRRSAAPTDTSLF